MRRRVVVGATIVIATALATLCGGAVRAATGDIAEFTLENASETLPTDLVTTDGKVWFSESGAGRIGRATPSGAPAAFDVPFGHRPGAVTVGQDGNVWFTEPDDDRIGRIKHTGAIAEFPTPAQASPYDITAASDGFLWYTTLSGPVRL